MDVYFLARNISGIFQILFPEFFRNFSDFISGIFSEKVDRCKNAFETLIHEINVVLMVQTQTLSFPFTCALFERCSAERFYHGTA